MAGVNETKNGNIVRSTKLRSLTGYSNTNRTNFNMVNYNNSYIKLEQIMNKAQNELNEASIALRNAQSNYIRAQLAHTQLLSKSKSFDIRKNFGNNTYNRMVEQSKQNLIKLGTIQTSAEDNFNNAEDKFINAENKFNKFKQNFKNSKKTPSSSWFSLGRGGRKTHKRNTNKRNKTKRNRN